MDTYKELIMKLKTIRKEAKKISGACWFSIIMMIDNMKYDKTITKKVLIDVLSSYRKAYNL